MDGKFAKISPFQVDPDRIPDTFDLREEDFAPAGDTEKASMVEKHKSVSYWKDAARRFKANHVSMVALFIFILVLIFAFIGPKLIPYSYGDQYRSSQKLGPREFSEGEALIAKASSYFDGFYATALQPGSITAVMKGEQYVTKSGKTYAFTQEKNEEGVIIGFEKSSGNLVKVYEKDIDPATGAVKNATVLAEEPSEPAEGASELKLVKRVFPHMFGTDSVGRDLMARTMYGARVSIIVGVVAVAIACVVGVFLGLCTAYFGGWVDTVIMRLSEALMAVPRIMVSMALIAILGNSMMDLAVILSFSTIPMYIRMTRAMALGIKNTDYVKAAQIQGGSSLYIMFRHVLPNSISPIIILMMQNVGMTILMESGLSFLGIGITIPIPSWGTMVEAGRMYLLACPVLAISPGACVALLVISLNLLGDGIRDALDPRLRGEV